MAENKEKRYVSDNAQLMAEWDWEKNNELGLYPQKISYENFVQSSMIGYTFLKKI